MKRALVILAVLVSGAAAACGSSNSSSSSPGGAAAGSSSSSNASLPLGAGGGNFCDLIKSYTEQFKSIGNQLSDPTKAKAYFQTLIVAVGQLVDAAPDELKSDGRLIQTEFTTLVAALDKVNYDFTKLSADDSKMLSAPEVSAANKHFETYISTACGITPGSGATP